MLSRSIMGNFSADELDSAAHKKKLAPAQQIRKFISLFVVDKIFGLYSSIAKNGPAY